MIGGPTGTISTAEKRSSPADSRPCVRPGIDVFERAVQLRRVNDQGGPKQKSVAAGYPSATAVGAADPAGEVWRSEAKRIRFSRAGRNGRWQRYRLAGRVRAGAGFFKFVEMEDELSELLQRKVDLVMRPALRPRIGRRVLAEAKPV